MCSSDLALNGMADIAQGRAGFDHGDAAHQGFISDIAQAPRLQFRLAGEIHARTVAEPAVQGDGDIDIHHIAVLEDAVAGNTVADDMIDGNADRFGKAAIVQGRGIGAVIDDEIMAVFVQGARRHAGLYMAADQVQALGGQSAGAGHGLEIVRRVKFDQAGIFRRRLIGRHVVHLARFPINYSSSRSAVRTSIPLLSMVQA